MNKIIHIELNTIVVFRPAPACIKPQVRVRDAMRHARDSLLTDRPELFMKGETVRPGVLVLVNDADWELRRAGNRL